MSEPLILTSDHPILQEANFKPYRSTVTRRVIRFLPNPNQPQEIDIITPWGETLTAQSGDYLVSEMDKPNDAWPVEAYIFEETYVILQPGICVKNALTYLAPLTDFTHGDPNAKVTIQSLEGLETVSAGDFYLARGVKGEIWAFPAEKIGKVVVPAE